MLLVEAGLMATVSAAGGVAFGVGVGWVAASGLIRAYGHGAPTVPVGQLMAFTALAMAAALLAAVLPARRAARGYSGGPELNTIPMFACIAMSAYVGRTGREREGWCHGRGA